MMERYELTDLPNLTDADHAGRIHAYLTANGVDCSGVSVGTRDGQPVVWVVADDDPTALLAEYVPTLTPEETERAELLADAQTAISDIRAKNPNARSATEKALLGLAVATDAPVFTPSTPEEPIPDVEPVAPAEVDV